MSEHSEPRVRSLALEPGFDAACNAYNEPAFHHFLAIEERRAERSGRVVLLVLVDLGEGPLAIAIAPDLAARLFSALIGCVREIDFVGWYRTNLVVGAVLMQDAGAVAPDTLSRLGARVTGHLRARLASSFGTQIQVRVVHVRPIAAV